MKKECQTKILVIFAFRTMELLIHPQEFVCALIMDKQIVIDFFFTVYQYFVGYLK